MMTVRDLIDGLDVVALIGDVRKSVTGIEFDSRKVSSGMLFVAVRGYKSDGHDYIPQALEAGACAIICEKLPAAPSTEICWIVVTDSAAALGKAASSFFGNPSASLRLVGVTGTNGKTTIATLLYRMFTGLGYKCGLFSTVCNLVNGRELPATHTTPDPVQLNKLMAEMADEGCTFAFMEVSSHSADQKRIAGLQFCGAIFTNLTHDHLDYHKTFDNYLAAKKSFFDALTADAFALINADDRNGRVMIQNCRARKYTFSVRGMADFRCSIIEQGFEGMQLRIQGEEVWTRFIGDFNASNLLAVYAASELLGAEKKEILTVLSNLYSVSGRLEVLKSTTGISGIVDYAHTPDALQNVIDTINRIREGSAKLITVVGAGGDRDRTKRPRMASIAAAGSNRTILTSDNPRSEEPDAILDEMEAGLTSELRRRTLRIPDRRMAIRTAVMMAEKGDVILIAGKGHETYQEIKGVKHHFDDREELNEAFLLK